jgi:hypothetical protein
VVLPDNHAEGRDHGEQVVASLRGIAKRIRVLDIGKHWAECPNKGDIADWLAAGGGTAEKLKAIIGALPEASASADNQHSQWRLVAQLASEITPRRSRKAAYCRAEKAMRLLEASSFFRPRIALPIPTFRA